MGSFIFRKYFYCAERLRSAYDKICTFMFLTYYKAFVQQKKTYYKALDLCIVFLNFSG